MARKFFYVCAGLLCLAIAFQLGVRSAGAQAGATVSGVTFGSGPIGGPYSNDVWVFTGNGDVYARTMRSSSGPDQLYYYGNFWSGAGPVNVEKHTLGELKAKYR